MSDIKISIVIASYKYGHLISQAIESVLCQTDPPNEVIIVDDGVGDLPDIVKLYGDNFKNLGITLKIIAREKNLGVVDNFQDVLMNHVTGDYVMFLGADNYIHPRTLEKLSNFIPENDIVSYDINLFGTEAEKFSKIIRSQYNPDTGMYEWKFKRGDIASGNYIHGSSLYHVALARGFGYKHSGRKNSEEDWMLFKAMILVGGASHVHLSEPLLYYRRHSNNFNKI